MFKRSKKGRKRQQVQTMAQPPVIPPIELEVVEGEGTPKETQEKIVFSFPSPVRCERCGAIQTHAVSTQGGTQYRKCDNPVCGITFKIIGKPA